MQINGEGKDDYFYIGWLHLLISIGLMRVQLPFSSQCGPIIYRLMIFIAIQIKNNPDDNCDILLCNNRNSKISRSCIIHCLYVHTFTIETLSLAADGETLLLL